MSKIDELRWVRLFTPDHIPTYLIEQIKRKDYTLEDFYKYHQINCLRNTKEGSTLNPFSHLYALVDEKNLTKGFLWFTIDPMSKNIIIQTYTIDKFYWNGSEAVKKVKDLILDIRKKGNLNKIFWITDRPKHSAKHGFKTSKNVLMEYAEEEDNKNEAESKNSLLGESDKILKNDKDNLEKG